MSLTRPHIVPPDFMRRFKDYGLPIAIVLGVVFYKWISWLSFTVPYLIVSMLFFTFLKLKIRDMRLERVHFLLAFLQLALALGSYYSLRVFLPESVAQGAFNCFLCPAASASPVIIGMLGGNVAVGTAYVLLTSVGIAFVAPLLFSLVGNTEVSFLISSLTIFAHILPIILTPLLLANILRVATPRLHSRLIRYTSLSFWVWLLALAIVIAKTVAYMIEEPSTEIPTMIILSVVGLVACLVQFFVGKWISSRFLSEEITLGQSLGQKNSSLAIWMAQVYLDPLSSVAMAAYSIWQNLFNSIQLMIHSRTIAKEQKQESKQ